MNKIGNVYRIALYLAGLVIFGSCAKPDTGKIDLEGVLGYRWNTSIMDIEKEFVKNKYSEINTADDAIVAGINYDGFPAEIFINFFNGKMYSGGFFLLGIENLDKEAFYETEGKLLKNLEKKYGDPQESEKESSTDFVEKEDRFYRWNFKNNCSVEIRSSFITSTFVNLRFISVKYVNNDLLKEKELAEGEIPS